MLESSNQYLRRLKTLNIKRLGKGRYSAVYAHPTLNDTAVKVIYDPDPQYVKFAKRCMRLNNPWLPRIYAIEKVHFADSVSHIIFMERLEKPTVSQIKKACEKVQNGLEAHFKVPPPHRFSSFFRSHWIRISQTANDQQIRQLAKIMCAVGANDIHDGNVMMRGDQLVFTDPVAS